jgi:cell division control protein 7
MHIMARQRGVKISEIAIREDSPEDVEASDVEVGEVGSGSEMSEDMPSNEDIDDAVADDMERFEASFEGISDRYRLINRIGEGELPLAILLC